MKFKTITQQDQYDSQNMHPMLKEILLDAESFSIDSGFGDLTITSIYRTPAEDLELHGSGIHSTNPYRAADVRATSWDDPNMGTVARYLHNRYIYDISRPSLTVALFKPHGNGPHIHVQCSSRTQLRNS